ncbi:MAG: NAD(P)/FAD-dependent oxidoreductase [Candidatus Sericytochromatia bacterium]|nr:NAD(P)/FAD-dependent oxidoreductase [Candidatus Sericytochromatia bacterium]
MNKKIVIIGGGFGGLSAAKTFKNKNVDVTLVNKTNYHLFQPLLYQVATASLSPSDIASPIRSILRNQQNVKVILDEVIEINKENSYINLKSEGHISFDYLIIAVGAKHSYFGHDEWEKFAPGLKTLNDALNIRERVLSSFEKAEITEDLLEREKYLNFVIVGGGPTGVEMAGAIAEIARDTLVKDFRNIDSKNTKIQLIEGQERLLMAYDNKLSEYTRTTLEKMGVKVRAKTVVTEINENGIKIGDEFISSNNVIWAAGNKAAPVLKTLNIELDNSGRVIVDSDLSIPLYPNIFVIGDAANAKDNSGVLLPGLAPVATQAGKYVANLIIKDQNKEQRKAFKYFDKGTMATIGRAKAVVKIGGFEFTGFFAWLTWTFVHIMFLVSFRSKVIVMLQWLWLYISNQRNSRLIVKENIDIEQKTLN